MTDLGKLLVEISIEPQLGKMVFMGLSLKCLEPAIIIACCSAYKEPCKFVSLSFWKCAVKKLLRALIS